MYFDEAIAHLLERKKKWYMHKISWSRADVEAIIVVTNAASRPTQAPGDSAYCSCEKPLPTREFRTCNQCGRRISPSA